MVEAIEAVSGTEGNRDSRWANYQNSLQENNSEVDRALANQGSKNTNLVSMVNKTYKSEMTSLAESTGDQGLAPKV